MKRIFEDTSKAFVLKSDSELERAYFLFKLISNAPLVRIGKAMTDFALRAHLPVDKLIRATVFDHFCGGVSEADCMQVVDRMYEKGVGSVLDYSVEGQDDEDPLDFTLGKTLEILDFVKQKKGIPFAVFKPTGYGRSALFKKVTQGEELTDKEQAEWARVVDRYDKTCKKAFDLDVSLLIDAEESWKQGAADQLVEDMMRKYNKEKAIVFNTLQMYRWDRMDYLKGLYATAQREGFKIGIKSVRGAYMEKERLRADKKGYKSPICETKKATDGNFDACTRYALDRLECISLFAGTHNEESSYYLMQLMKEKGLDKNDKRIWFGQLYGMSDHISFNLADQGYNAAKYLPFGPVRDVMPYLIRRAEENTSVAGQTSRELKLLKKERKRRKI
ncbi:MAG: proline dehydrogenase [Maribacter sp.]|nr:MAG: proline dehydrogenase [Maribacter sp.]